VLSPVVVVVVVVVVVARSFVLSAWAVRLAVILTCNAARKSLDILEKGYNMYNPGSFVLEIGPAEAGDKID
jgi:hypothetical protein